MRKKDLKKWMKKLKQRGIPIGYPKHVAPPTGLATEQLAYMRRNLEIK